MSSTDSFCSYRQSHGYRDQLKEQLGIHSRGSGRGWEHAPASGAQGLGVWTKRTKKCLSKKKFLKSRAVSLSLTDIWLLHPQQEVRAEGIADLSLSPGSTWTFIIPCAAPRETVHPSLPAGEAVLVIYGTIQTAEPPLHLVLSSASPANLHVCSDSGTSRTTSCFPARQCRSQLLQGTSIPLTGQR